jgi:hypothetical protein
MSRPGGTRRPGGQAPEAPQLRQPGSQNRELRKVPATDQAIRPHSPATGQAIRVMASREGS